MTRPGPDLRQDLPNILRLADAARALNCGQGDCYFRPDFEHKLVSEPVIFAQFKQIEDTLACLDECNLKTLVKKCAPRFCKKDQHRGWQQAFDILNEANGFAYLVRLGAENLNFVPNSSERTPDIEGVLNGTPLLCEVKTINISKDESHARPTSQIPVGRARSTVAKLPENFHQKLQSTLTSAERQITGYQNTKNYRLARCCVYVVINFDDSLHEYANDYMCQIKASDLNWPSATCVIETKKPFSSAMSSPPAPMIERREPNGAWA